MEKQGDLLSLTTALATETSLRLLAYLLFSYSISYTFPQAFHSVDRIMQVCIFWFGLVSLFNGISTFIGYLMPKPFSEKNSSSTI